MYPNLKNYRYYYKFRTQISAKAWLRLESYGKLVQRLEISDKTNRIMDSNAMKILASQRPTFSLTPNLQHMYVKWQNDEVLEYCFLFFSRRVRSLTLCLPTLNWFRFSNVLEIAIFSRARGLKSLNIETCQPLSDGDVGSLLKCALPYMRNIENLVLPQFSLTPSIMAQVAGKLKKITQNDTLASNIATSTSGPPNPLTLTFASTIEELHVGTMFRSVLSVTSWNYPKLISLHIDFLWQYEDSDSLRDLIKKISAIFLKLQQLKIAVSKVRQPQLNTTKTISSEPLNALTTMRNLKYFSLRWCTPIVCTNEELIELLKGLPHIEYLHLNERPVFTHIGTAITLDVLASIARVCPDLRQLALFIDCTVPPAVYDPLSYSDPTEEEGLFAKLESLDLGASPVVRDPFSIARRLYDIIPTRCKFPHPGGKVPVPGAKVDTIAVATWENLCKDVGEFIRALLVGREEGRRRFNRRMYNTEEKSVEANL